MHGHPRRFHQTWQPITMHPNKLTARHGIQIAGIKETFKLLEPITIQQLTIPHIVFII
jgi:hypothetical protein